MKVNNDLFFFTDGIIDGDLQEGVHGFSILKPELCYFKYTDRNNTRTTPRLTTVPKSHKKPYCQRKRSTSVEDDISDIIEILSSPEKSPFKEDIVKIRATAPVVLQENEFAGTSRLSQMTAIIYQL